MSKGNSDIIYMPNITGFAIDVSKSGARHHRNDEYSGLTQKVVPTVTDNAEKCFKNPPAKPS